jgi:hypothetical protein
MKEVDCIAIHKEMNDFKPVAEQMQKDLGENAQGMMKAFCVCVFMAQLNADGKWYGKYDNHRVLVGPQEKIDACNKMIKEKVTGSFEVNE